MTKICLKIKMVVLIPSIPMRPANYKETSKESCIETLKSTAYIIIQIFGRNKTIKRTEIEKQQIR